MTPRGRGESRSPMNPKGKTRSSDVWEDALDPFIRDYFVRAVLRQAQFNTMPMPTAMTSRGEVWFRVDSPVFRDEHVPVLFDQDRDAPGRLVNGPRRTTYGAHDGADVWAMLDSNQRPLRCERSALTS
jgi:hypothetical protein